MNKELRQQLWCAIIMTLTGIMIGLLGDLYTVNKIQTKEDTVVESVVVESKADDTDNR